MILLDRAVLSITGRDALKFLQGLVTNDVRTLAEKQILYAMILNNTGRLLFELFLIYRDEECVLVDHHEDDSDALLEFLRKNRFRSKVDFTLLSDTRVYASNNEGLVDPRETRLGRRLYIPNAEATGNIRDYHKRRINLRVPDAHLDMVPGVSMPLDFRLDELNGISFNKGCYCGQEAMSKAHNIVGKKRTLYMIESDTALPKGADIICNEQVVGRVCGFADGIGLGLFNIERCSGGAAEANGQALTIRLP
jgi:folate-binding protein YgfZ